MILPLVIKRPKPSVCENAYPDRTDRLDLLPEKGLGNPLSPLLLILALR